MKKHRKFFHKIDRKNLPRNFPTHFHESRFWEQLGRTIATYGFLEEVLGKAIFAFTQLDDCRENIDEEYLSKKIKKLEEALVGNLKQLADRFEVATRGEEKLANNEIKKLVGEIKKAAVIRDVLCHGSWQKPNSDGAPKPFFVNKNVECFETEIDFNWLKQVQDHVVNLVCEVIDCVTMTGRQFPGASSDGT